jgi:hypothetical protein
VTAMTPIKSILALGLGLFAVDMADHRQQLCSAIDPATARWLAQSLSRAHGVRAYVQADDLAPREEVTWAADA